MQTLMWSRKPQCLWRLEWQTTGQRSVCMTRRWTVVFSRIPLSGHGGVSWVALRNSCLDSLNTKRSNARTGASHCAREWDSVASSRWCLLDTCESVALNPMCSDSKVTSSPLPTHLRATSCSIQITELCCAAVSRKRSQILSSCVLRILLRGLAQSRQTWWSSSTVLRGMTSTERCTSNARSHAEPRGAVLLFVGIVMMLVGIYGIRRGRA